MTKDPGIDYWRGKIDRLNHAILRLLQTRVAVAKRIGVIKRKHGLPISDLSREKAILDNLVKENQGPLDDKALLAIFKAIIRETKRLERGAKH